MDTLSSRRLHDLRSPAPTRSHGWRLWDWVPWSLPGPSPECDPGIPAETRASASPQLFEA